MQSAVTDTKPRAPAVDEDEDSSVDRTGLGDCLSMQCGSEFGEGVLFDDSGQRREVATSGACVT